MKNIVFFSLFFSLSFSLCAQELFPSREPASSFPKGVTGIRYNAAYFQDGSQNRQFHAIRLMYGATARLSLMLTGMASNFHLREFPPNYFNIFSAHHSPTYVRDYPFLPKTVHLYAKYRFLSFDEQQRHLRMAFYAEGAAGRPAHDFAEPDLMGDNAGLGGGLIITHLYKKFAVSATLGLINPFPYTEPANGLLFRSGNGKVFDFSFGYLLFPTRYQSYQDMNVNLYVEFINRSFDAATWLSNGIPQDITFSPFLQEGVYSEVRPAIQFIFNSVSRLDLSAAFPFYQRSFSRKYPMIMLGFQKYFYSGRKKTR